MSEWLDKGSRRDLRQATEREKVEFFIEEREAWLRTRDLVPKREATLREEIQQLKQKLSDLPE